MKGMKSAKEYFQAPPPGRYKARIELAEADLAKKSGATMLRLEGIITEPPEHAGAVWRDYIITDGYAKGGGLGKVKLRGLGVDVSTDDEIPDEEIARSLLGRELWIEFDNEPLMGQDANGEYTVPQTVFDERLQQTVQLQKLVVKAYLSHNVGLSQQPVAPARQPAPQFGPQPAPQVAPPAPQFGPGVAGNGAAPAAVPPWAMQQARPKRSRDDSDEVPF